MKKQDTLIFSFMIFFMIFSVHLLAQEAVDELIITNVNGSQLAVNKGDASGIQVNWIYDIKRVVKNDTFYIGTALVDTVEQNISYLIPYTIQDVQVLPGDILVHNHSATEKLLESKNISFWDTIHKKYTDLDEYALHDGRIFKNCKIKLKDGNTLKVDQLTVKNVKGVLIPEKFSAEDKLVPLENIQSIKTSTNNYAFWGALLGAGIGGSAILLMHKDKVENDTTYYYMKSQNAYGDVIGWSKMMKIEEKDYRLSFSKRLGLIGGGYLVGALVGYAFKGGWREIYSDANKANGISMKWSIQNHLSDAISLNLKFQF